MQSNRRISSLDDAEKTTEIERIIEEVMRQRRAGLSLDDSAIERQHPDLLPELGERLRTLRAVEAAARQAKQQPSSGASIVDGNSPFEEDMEYLRRTLANYEILEPLDYGGQGVVYKALQRSTRRTVAIKVLLDGPLASERQRHRFTREVELISRLQHPNIVTLYESGVVRKRPYFAMEYVEGVPVDDYVLLHNLPIADIVRLFVTICRAVSYAHQHGIIHRDLGPGNILVDLQGVPHILDFGLAKDVWTDAAPHDHSFLTIPGQVFGTLPYLSPEQAGARDAQVDVRSDIYSLGIVLFELLTGGFPYPVDGDPAEVRANVVSREPLRLRKAFWPDRAPRHSNRSPIVRDLEMVLLKALSKDKARRYQSAAAFADDLERCLAGEVVEARADNRFYLLRRTFRKYRLAAVVATLFLVVLSGSSVAVTMMWVQARTQRDNARDMARQAVAILHDVTTDIDESISSLAGGMEVRDRLLNHVVADRLARLRPLVESDVAMEDVRAALHEKQGDIAYKQGSRADAAEHYRAFLDISGRRVQVRPLADARLQDLARAHRKLARVSEDAVAHLERAVEIGQKVIGRGQGAMEPKYALCDTLIDFGRHLFRKGQYRRAAEQIDSALTIAGPMVVTNGNDERWSALLATAHEWDGDIQLKLGDAVRSIQSLKKSLELREWLIETSPADVNLRHAEVLSCLKLGGIYRDAGQIGAAMELFERAVNAGEYLATVDPTVAIWKRDLHAAYERLIRALLQSGDLELARSFSDSAVALADSLVQSEPANAEWNRILAFSLMRRGMVWLSRGEPQRSHNDFEAALIIRKNLSRAKPDDLALQAELAATHDWLGKCCVKLSQLERALTHYVKAHGISQALFRLQPAVTQRALDVIRAQTNLATAYLAQVTPAGDVEATRLLKQAEDALTALAASGRLAGLEDKCQKWMEAIRKNLQLIAIRAEQRTKPEGSAGPGPAGCQRP